MDDAGKRHLRRQRVRDGCLARSAVPAMHALVAEPHARERTVIGFDLEASRRHLVDVSAAPLVEDRSAAEKACEGPTVAAVTTAARTRRPVDAARDATNLSTCTTQRHVHARKLPHASFAIPPARAAKLPESRRRAQRCCIQDDGVLAARSQCLAFGTVVHERLQLRVRFRFVCRGHGFREHGACQLVDHNVFEGHAHPHRNVRASRNSHERRRSAHTVAASRTPPTADTTTVAKSP